MPYASAERAWERTCDASMRSGRKRPGRITLTLEVGVDSPNAAPRSVSRAGGIMKRFSIAFVGAMSIAALTVGCKKNDPPPVAPTPTAQVPATPPQPGQPGWTPPPGQPGQPGQPPVAQPGQMAIPGPAALPCQNDSQCMTHRCNLQYGKCAFPCVSDADCIQGTMCFVGGGPLAACVPKPPGTP